MGKDTKPKIKNKTKKNTHLALNTWTLKLCTRLFGSSHNPCGLTSDLDKQTRGESLTGKSLYEPVVCLIRSWGEWSPHQRRKIEDVAFEMWTEVSIESPRKGKGQLWWMVNSVDLGVWPFQKCWEHISFSFLASVFVFHVLNCFSYFFFYSSFF